VQHEGGVMIGFSSLCELVWLLI